MSAILPSHYPLPKPLKDETPKRAYKRKLKFDEIDMAIAHNMYDRILNMTAAPHPNFDIWADCLRRIRTKYKVKHSVVREVFECAQKDLFWRSKILSPNSLHKNFPKLFIMAGGKQAIRESLEERTNLINIRKKM